MILSELTSNENISSNSHVYRGRGARRTIFALSTVGSTPGHEADTKTRAWALKSRSRKFFSGTATLCVDCRSMIRVDHTRGPTLSFLPTSGRKTAKTAAALALSGAMLFAAGAAPAAAAETSPSNTGSSVVEPQAPAGSEFEDITVFNQFYKEIHWVHQNGIAAGWSDGTYRPLAPVSREAMAAFMHRLDALKGEKDSLPGSVPQFSDVAGTQFEGEIAWLLGTGITTGYPDGTFRPHDNVNRDAMAAYLYRMAGFPEFTPPKVSPFADVATDNQFYREISWLAATGISTGWEASDRTRTFAPLAPVARDAMAAFMHRFHEKGYGPKA